MKLRGKRRRGKGKMCQSVMNALKPYLSERERWVRTIDVLTNHRELHIESNSVSASCIRFWERMESVSHQPSGIAETRRERDKKHGRKNGRG